MKKIFVSAFRDVYFNKTRSIVVVLSLVMVIAFPLALTNVPENLNQIIIDEREEYNLAHLIFFFVDIVDEKVGEKLHTLTADYLERDFDEIIVEGRIHDSSKMRATGNNRLEKGTGNLRLKLIEEYELLQICEYGFGNLNRKS